MHPFHFMGSLRVSASCLLIVLSGICSLLSFFFSSFFLVVFALFSFFMLSLELFVDVPLIFSCPADHVVPDWQPRILLGMVGIVGARGDTV